MALAKLVCNIDEDLLKQVDEYAASLHVTRTAAVCVLLSDALRTQKVMESLPEFLKAYRLQQSSDAIQ